MEGGRMLQLSAIMTILSLFLNIATAVAKNDTISSSQPLTRNETIVSAGQVFELGFFSPGNSNKWFIGIWYKKFPTKPKTVVWVANRDNPLSSSSGTLTIFENGKLILTNESGKTIWQSNQITLSSNIVAQILDTGNFVVRRKEDNDPKNYLWQSFDYPTNTLLPGMKLGIDKKTGLNRFLTSWKNEDDPSSGGFFFKLNFNGFPEFILWKDQTKVYRSGPWNGLRLSGVLGLGTMSDIMNLTFVMDQNENTYSFQMTDSSNYSRLSLNPYGSLERFLWIQMSQKWNVLWYAPYDHCDMYKECGAFGICDTTTANLCQCMKGFQPKNKPAWNLRDRSLGCARTIELNCPNDGFIRVKNVKLPESSNAVLNGSMSLEDCKNSCQKDCSCTAFARMDVRSGSGCVTWKGDLTDLRKYQTPKGGQPLFVRVPNVLDEGSDLLLNTTGAGKPKSLPGSGSKRKSFKVWNDIRIVILLSLSLQIILVLMSPLRKRVSSVFVSIPLWLAYTLFNIVATYGLGLIANSQTQKSNTAAYGRIANSQTQKSNTAAYGLIANSNTQKSNTAAVDLEASYALRSVHALWAPFLLFHLGGPDTITAFTLADNELWLRNSLALFVQGWLVSYIFAHSFFIDTPHYKKLFPDDKLWLPTILINIAGLIKYVERIRALYLASTERFRGFSLIDPVPDPNYAKLMDEKIEMTPEPETVIPTTPEVKKMTDLEIVQAAHHFFDTFKGLIAELILSFRERTKSRGFFFQRTPRDAFKVVEVELNFIYEILYTKFVVVHSTLGYILRFVTIGLTCASLVLFYKLGSYNIERIDRTITKILHIGALALDVIGFIMAFTSDLTAVKLTKKNTILFKCLRAILHVDRDRWPEKNQADKKQPDRKKGFVKIFLSMIMEFLAKVTDYYYFREIMRRRWSGLIPQYNLIHYCLNPRPKRLDKVISWFNLTNMVDTFRYATSEKFDSEISDFIFYELKMKSEGPDDLKISEEIHSARGDRTLRVNSHNNLLPWIIDADYDESLLMWHIATDLCYSETEAKNSPTDVRTHQRFAKILSDHMLYLLMMEATMMAPVAGIVEKRFRDTCAVAKSIFEGSDIYKLEKEENKEINNKEGRGIKKEEVKGEEPNKTHEKACLNLLNVQTEVKPADLKGERSKSVLFDACMLAKELNKEGQKWEIMSKVWVELLCYAASRCRPSSHASQLSKGGQFITLVWLLMAHFGLGNHFQTSEGRARAIPIADK